MFKKEKDLDPTHNAIEKTKTFYNSIAPSYNTLHGTEQFQKFKLIQERIKNLKNEGTINIITNPSLLDIGCGTGLSTIGMKSIFNSLITIGIDPSDGLLEKAKNINIKEIQELGKAYYLEIQDNVLENIEFIEMQAEKLTLETKKFNIITSLTAIQNFADYKIAVNEMIKVAKDSNTIFVISILKKSVYADQIANFLIDSFRVIEELDESKDRIFILKQI